jgi:hypothetical protein
MGVSAKNRLVATAVCTACQLAVFRRVAVQDDCLGNGNVVLALLPVDLQSGHGVVIVSQSSDPCESHLGRDRGKLSRLAAGAGNGALLDRHRRVCPGTATASRSLAGSAHATHQRSADRAALQPWRWLGRTVKLFDGSTISMPDTPKNQAAYPQSRAQATGVSFPLARIGVLFSLSVGAVLDSGIRRWAANSRANWRCSAA